MTLGEKQRLFARLIGELLVWAYAHGYEFSFGEAERKPAQAAANASAGTGISNSLHLRRLAVDLNLFVHGVYQTDSRAHLPIGQHWESMHPLCRWGGRFSRPDGNHYSLEHEGVR